MTFGQMKMRCMAQFGADPEDLREFLPEIEGYLNDAYELMSWYYDKRHVGPLEEDRARLRDDIDIPGVPEWTHGYMCDYATYLIYRNGNQQRQQRGIPFLSRWQEGLAQLRSNAPPNGVPQKFRNLYVYEPLPPPSPDDWRAAMASGNLTAFDPLR